MACCKDAVGAAPTAKMTSGASVTSSAAYRRVRSAIGPRYFGSRSERRAHQPFCGTRTSGARAGHPATDKNADNQCYREKNSFTR